MSGVTPRRTIRVDDELWDAAGEAAAQDGYTLSDIVRSLLAEYVRQQATNDDD